MALGINVDGTHHVIPGVFSIVDASDLVDPPSFPTGRIAILGPGSGLLEPGIPHQVMASMSNITAVLQPSDLRTAAMMAINPSPELSGVPEMWLLPVNPSTRSTYQLKGAGAVTLLTFQSAGWGVKYNDLKMSFSTTTNRLTITLDTIVEVYQVATTGTTKIADLKKLIEANSSLVDDLTFGVEGSPTVITDAPFTGGTEGAITSQHWIDAFGQLGSRDIQLVMVTTDDTTIHGLLATHVAQTLGRGFFGYEFAAENWKVFSNREENIAALEADRQISVGAAGQPRMLTPGIGGMYDGVMYPSRLTCALWLGAAALVPPTKPLTNLALNLGQLEVEMDDGEVGEMLSHGFSVPMRNHGPTRQGYVISRQQTTWVKDDNLSRIEFSVGRGVDAIQRAVIEELWQFVGQEGVAAVPARAVFVTNKLLLRAATGLDVLRIVTFTPRVTRGELIGTILRVYFEYTPILPVNYVIAIARLRRTNIIATITDSFDISLSGLGASIGQQAPVG